MRKILFIGLVVTAVVLISGCYGPTTSPNATIQPTGGTPSSTASTATGTATATASTTVATVNTVNITSTGYDPAIISVPSGTTVTWTNTDTVSHTVKSKTGDFDSGSVSGGQRFSWTFNTAGSYDYGDTNNASMSGTVIVTSTGNVAVTGTSYATPVTTVTGTATAFPTVVTANTVKITSSGYDPAIISVPIGTRVTWTNTDTKSHTVTSNTGDFDSGSLGSGSTFSWTFSTSGSYDYGDSNNASMGGGTVIVTS